MDILQDYMSVNKLLLNRDSVHMLGPNLYANGIV